MNAPFAARNEHEALRRLREEFEPQGFSVIENPTPEQLPAFIGNHRPDALLLGPTGNMIVEIKKFPSSDEENVRAEAFAREIPKHKDWKFLLVLLKPDSYPTLDAAEISRAIDQFDAPSSDFSQKQSFVMAWAVFEAAARLTRERIDDDKKVADLPTFALLERLAFLGALDDQEVARLTELAMTRNRIVHGGLDETIPSTAKESLLTLARRLMERAG